MKVDLEELARLKEKGYVYYKEHPTFPELRLWKYLQITTYQQLWNPLTKMCRGLVVDDQGNCINAPMLKAFNIEEHLGGESLKASKKSTDVVDGDIKIYVNNISVKGTIPKNEKFKLYTKEDGSIIYVTIYKDTLLITSSGSFDSEHAQIANEWFKTKYKDVVSLLEKGKTYGFELIHPKYQIVVDYGDIEELVLLCVKDNETGKDYDIEDYKHLGFRLPDIYDVDTLEGILALQAENHKNKEGFIALYESGFRTKIKFEDYLNRHRFKSETRLIDLWQILRDGKDVYTVLSDLLALVEDEFYDKLTVHVKRFNDQFLEKKNEIMSVYQSVLDTKSLTNRKEQAQYIIQNHSQYKSFLFGLLDGKNIDKLIWDLLVPNKTDRLF